MRRIVERKGLAEHIPDDVIFQFEEKLNPAYPEKSEIELRVIGYGEISTTFNIPHPCCEKIVFKRIPIFENEEQLRDYTALYNEYLELLMQNGVELPEHGYLSLVTDDGRIVFYDIQELLPANSIGNRIIHLVDNEQSLELFKMVLEKMRSVWQYNLSHPEKHIGIDGQISNWALPEFPDTGRVNSGMKIVYIDVSTPMIRENGRHMLNAELFLKSTPPGLRWIARRFFLQDVLDRYHDLHLVIVDLIANLYKEKREDLIPEVIKFTNNFIKNKMKGLDVEEIDFDEVKKYYKEDAFIWSFYLTARKIDRFIKTRILKTRYEFILPGKIER